jgi:hypothetical protein
VTVLLVLLAIIGLAIVAGIFLILIQLGNLMSDVDDLVTADAALKGSVDAAVVKLGTLPGSDPRIAQVTADLNAAKAALDGAVNAPPPALPVR